MLCTIAIGNMATVCQRKVWPLSDKDFQVSTDAVECTSFGGIWTEQFGLNGYGLDFRGLISGTYCKASKKRSWSLSLVVSQACACVHVMVAQCLRRSIKSCVSALCIFTSTASIRGVASAAHINKGLDDRLSRITFP